EEAFTPAPHIAVVDQLADGSWIPWTVMFPAAPGMPGDPLPDGHRWTIATYVSRAVGMLRALLTHLDPAAPPPPPPPPGGGAPPPLLLARRREPTPPAPPLPAPALPPAPPPAPAPPPPH